MDQIPNSTSFQLNKTDLIRLGKLLAYTGSAAILTMLTQVYVHISYVIHVGGMVYDLSPVAIVGLASLLRLAKSYLTDYAKRNGFVDNTDSSLTQ